MNNDIKNAAKNLNTIFNRHGFSVWFVGGCVRDLVIGKEPDDFDLTTDANPTEQIEIYKQENISYYTTGLQHGTLTVSVDGEMFEVTSMRTDISCDGRHAEVEYTRDLTIDLARRDFTFNAMAMDMDGNITDPFGGVADLENGVVRTVGDAEMRFVEDYLRIMRFYRFTARYGKTEPLEAVKAAIQTQKHGLSIIAVERIWDEIRKIMMGPNPAETMTSMMNDGIFKIFGFPEVDYMKINNLPDNNRSTYDPIFCFHHQRR